jgi:hypothetical protein
MEHAVKTKRRGQTKFHGATYGLMTCDLLDYQKNGEIVFTHEHQLSKGSLRIDTVIKKTPDAKMAKTVYKIFREYNIVEYKSPASPPLTVGDFNKTVHSYAGTYSWQEKVDLTDMTATIVCHQKPTELLETLKEKFHYKVLRKYSGIYYITYKGVPPAKTLAVQIIVVPELPDSYAPLKALGANEDDEELVIKALKTIVQDEELLSLLSDWFDIMSEKHYSTFYKEVKTMNGIKKFLKLAEKDGELDEYKHEWEQKGRQEGRQEILALLDEDTKRRLQIA